MRTVGMGAEKKEIMKTDSPGLKKENKKLTARVAELEKEKERLTARVAELESEKEKLDPDLSKNESE